VTIRPKHSLMRLGRRRQGSTELRVCLFFFFFIFLGGGPGGFFFLKTPPPPPRAPPPTRGGGGGEKKCVAQALVDARRMISRQLLRPAGIAIRAEIEQMSDGQLRAASASASACALYQFGRDFCGTAEWVFALT